MTKRVRSSGMSKLLPLNVTSIDACLDALGDAREHRRLLAELAHEELLDDEADVVDPRTRGRRGTRRCRRRGRGPVVSVSR